MARTATAKKRNGKAKPPAKRNGTSKPLTIVDPSMFLADAGIGVKDLGSEDLAIPFLKVLRCPGWRHI